MHIYIYTYIYIGIVLINLSKNYVNVFMLSYFSTVLFRFAFFKICSQYSGMIENVLI